MKIVSIGLGGWGKNHVRVLSQLKVLSAVCDADEERSKQFGETYDVDNYTSVDTMLAQHDFDAALICTPTKTHFKIAEQLIEAGKNIFVEKPLTYDSAAGEKLVDLAEKNDTILTCGYIERFNPAVSHVKNYLQEKKYGDLLMLEFHRESRMPLHIKDVGIIYDTAVHDIDTALWLFDETPEIVFARAGHIRHEHEDFATIMLGFSNNKSAIISSNWITPTRVRTFNAVMTEAIISSDFITQKIKIETADGTYLPRKNIEEPLSLELANFVDTISNKSTQRVTARDAVNVTKIAEAALESSRNGAPVQLNL